MPMTLRTQKKVAICKLQPGVLLFMICKACCAPGREKYIDLDCELLRACATRF